VRVAVKTAASVTRGRCAWYSISSGTRLRTPSHRNGVQESDPPAAWDSREAADDSKLEKERNLRFPSAAPRALHPAGATRIRSNRGWDPRTSTRSREGRGLVKGFGQRGVRIRSIRRSYESRLKNSRRSDRFRKMTSSDDSRAHLRRRVMNRPMRSRRHGHCPIAVRPRRRRHDDDPARSGPMRARRIMASYARSSSGLTNAGR
jgi:hypothetical protein